MVKVVMFVLPALVVFLVGYFLGLRAGKKQKAAELEKKIPSRDLLSSLVARADDLPTAMEEELLVLDKEVNR